MDDVLEQGEAVQYYDKELSGVVEVTVQTVHRDDVPAYYTTTPLASSARRSASCCGARAR